MISQPLVQVEHRRFCFGWIGFQFLHFVIFFLINLSDHLKQFHSYSKKKKYGKWTLKEIHFNSKKKEKKGQ